MRLKRRQYKVGGFWGDAIDFVQLPPNDKGHCKVYGFKKDRPRKGDELLVKMSSGKMGVWRFKEVTYEWDPPDMFFGLVKFHHYLDSGEPS